MWAASSFADNLALDCLFQLCQACLWPELLGNQPSTMEIAIASV